MIFFGHLGITTGVVEACEKVFLRKKKAPVDYRYVLAGSILPDLIDKPIGGYLFRSTFNNSRIFCHSMLFSTSLVLMGLYFQRKYKNNTVLSLGVGTSAHIVLDQMWYSPGIFLWPRFGLKFPERTESNWIKSDVNRFLTDSNYSLPELIGFIIVVYYIVRLLRTKKFRKFLKSGVL